MEFSNKIIEACSPYYYHDADLTGRPLQIMDHGARECIEQACAEKFNGDGMTASNIPTRLALVSKWLYRFTARIYGGLRFQQMLAATRYGAKVPLLSPLPYLEAGITARISSTDRMLAEQRALFVKNLVHHQPELCRPRLRLVAAEPIAKKLSSSSTFWGLDALQDWWGTAGIVVGAGLIYAAEKGGTLWRLTPITFLLSITSNNFDIYYNSYNSRDGGA